MATEKNESKLIYERTKESTAHFTQFIHSEELKNLFKSIESNLQVPVNSNPWSFAEELMTAVHAEKLASDIKLLSVKLDLKKEISENEDPGTICVLNVDVIPDKDQLKVVKKDPHLWTEALHLEHKRVINIILVNSKSLRVVETKLRVFREYRPLFTSKTLFIHHSLEEFDEIAKLSAAMKLTSFQDILKSLIQSIPMEQLPSIITEASDRTMSRENIRETCYNIFIKDWFDEIGTVHSDKYICRFFVTVKRIKGILVEKALQNIGESFGSEICQGILRHIKSKVKSELRQDFLKLHFDITDEIFATITVVIVSFIVAVFSPILGLIFAVGSFVVTLVSSVNVNSERWRSQVADEIYSTVSKKREGIHRRILNMVEKICKITTKDLQTVSTTIENLRQKIDCLDMEKVVPTWEKKEAMQQIPRLKRHPSVLKYIAGCKNGDETMKVFLRHADEEAVKDFKQFLGDAINLHIVDVEKESKESSHDKEDSLYVVDRLVRESLSQTIKNQGERMYANHSSIVGLGIGTMNVTGKIMPCITIYCLDKKLIPYGEKPIPEYLEGWHCDLREDIVMFGACFNCRSIAYPNPGCCIGLPSGTFGSAGFLAKINTTEKPVTGFLTAAHVAAENWTELYHTNSFLSDLNVGDFQHEIYHPLFPENQNGQRIGRVRESFCGDLEGYGIDAAFVQNHKEFPGGGKLLEIADESMLKYDGSITVLKRGGTTGQTMGSLVDDSFSVCVDNSQGSFYFFDRCFAVDNIASSFFEMGDSGSGVYLTENGKPTKPLGIAFAKHQIKQKTAVCRVDKIVSAFNLSVYEQE